MPRADKRTRAEQVWGAWRDPIEISVLLSGGWLAAALLAGWAQAVV